MASFATDATSAAVTGAAAAPQQALWDEVDRWIGGVVTRGAGIDGLLLHKMGPLAAAWYARAGLEVPKVLHEEERAAAMGMMVARPLARRMREACEGPLLLLKGPEVAALYRGGARRFSDVDVLTPAAESVQAALLAAGFVEVLEEAYSSLVDHHHLHPIRYPTIWLNVEVHMSPNWPEHLTTPPPLSEILEAAVPSVLGVEGVSAPSRLHHALILASHAWRHDPVFRVRDLVDLAVLTQGISERDLDQTARRWGIGRLWRTTWGAVNALFDGRRETVAMRVIGRHLQAGRDRTVFENHLVEWLSPFWELPPGPAIAQLAQTARVEFSPGPNETWGRKLARTASAIRHPGSSSALRR